MPSAAELFEKTKKKRDGTLVGKAAEVLVIIQTFIYIPHTLIYIYFWSQINVLDLRVYFCSAGEVRSSSP